MGLCLTFAHLNQKINLFINWFTKYSIAQFSSSSILNCEYNSISEHKHKFIVIQLLCSIKSLLKCLPFSSFNLLFSIRSHILEVLSALITRFLGGQVNLLIKIWEIHDYVHYSRGCQRTNHQMRVLIL